MLQVMTMDEVEKALLKKKLTEQDMRMVDKLNDEIHHLLDLDLHYNGDNVYKINKLVKQRIELEHTIEERLGLRSKCRNCKNSSKCNK